MNLMIMLVHNIQEGVTIMSKKLITIKNSRLFFQKKSRTCCDFEKK